MRLRFYSCKPPWHSSVPVHTRESPFFLVLSLPYTPRTYFTHSFCTYVDVLFLLVLALGLRVSCPWDFFIPHPPSHISIHTSFGCHAASFSLAMHRLTIPYYFSLHFCFYLVKSTVVTQSCWASGAWMIRYIPFHLFLLCLQM
ncbi:hypothetical protein P691DRAFT_705987 [Macrolepiota fuliginosa MF-IS2]|uniref:Uncharacterized protein n=1 Tax=Macrolepiota fuliginosa MF-IS2 TaxID=1400762 RepID=A0A9P5XBX7_9AGAR|nr:hypothetical protein P691DRAFT_705987 [Macrolepiota fuliginosa MF-IS2]